MQIEKVEGRTWYVEEEIDEFMPHGADTPEELFEVEESNGKLVYVRDDDGRAEFDIGEVVALTFDERWQIIKVVFFQDGSYRIEQGDGSGCNVFGVDDCGVDWEPFPSLDDVGKHLVENSFHGFAVPIGAPVDVECFFSPYTSGSFRFLPPVDGKPRLECIEPEKLGLAAEARP